VKSHLVWEKVLIPVEVPGISQERFRELMPTTYLSDDEFKVLLHAQVIESKYYLDKNCPNLPKEIYNAMNFEY